MAPLPVFRLDADAVGRRRAWRDASQRFDAAPAGVLVGTQMVAKGHDFPDVTLGVVLDADATLRFPDFRAEERTFALVAQLAGRSGRGARGGRVVVQALDPDARALRHAAAARRRGLPRGRARAARGAALPAATAPDPRGVLGAASAGRETRRRRRPCASGIDLAAARPCSARRRCSGCKGRERAQLVVKSAEREAAIAAVRRAVEAAGRRSRARGRELRRSTSTRSREPRSSCRTRVGYGPLSSRATTIV